MKAILVIDLNDTTLNECDTDVSKCWAKVIVHTPIKGTAHGIGSCIYANDNVELKPMPQKNKYDVKKYATVDYENNVTLGHYLNHGWNACIDEILGDNDEKIDIKKEANSF